MGTIIQERRVSTGTELQLIEDMGVYHIKILYKGEPTAGGPGMDEQVFENIGVDEEMAENVLSAMETVYEDGTSHW